MEEPRYADISDTELLEIEAEFGHPVTRDLAYWFIRNRMNREAVERMLKTANPFDDPKAQNVPSIKKAKRRKQVSDLKKTEKKCA